MIRVSYFSDFTVFVSTWISNLYKNQGIKSINTGVILSGSDTEIFNNINKESWNKTTKLKIVTHHWGNNWNKGFDVYSLLDNLLEEVNFSEKFEFTFIGNLPVNFTLKMQTILNQKVVLS